MFFLAGNTYALRENYWRKSRVGNSSLGADVQRPTYCSIIPFKIRYKKEKIVAPFRASLSYGHYGVVRDDGAGDEDDGEPSFAVVRALVLLLLLAEDVSPCVVERVAADDDMPVELLLALVALLLLTVTLSHFHNVT